MRRDGDNDAIGTGAHPVRIAKSGGQRFHQTTIGRDPVHADRVHVIEVSPSVGFQAGHEMVRLRECLYQIAEVLVEIRFAVAIFVMQARDLVAAENINLVVDHFEPEWLV